MFVLKAAIAACVLRAMLAWAPVAVHKPLDHEPSVTMSRYESIATSIERAASDPAEAPLYRGEQARERTALLLASLAFWESRYWARVDEGRCALRECDAGFAWTIWQLHPEDGFVLTERGFTHARNRSKDWLLANASQVVHGPDLVHDRALAARVALHVLRQAGSGQWTTGRRAKAQAELWWARDRCLSKP